MKKNDKKNEINGEKLTVKSIIHKVVNVVFCHKSEFVIIMLMATIIFMMFRNTSDKVYIAESNDNVQKAINEVNNIANDGIIPNGLYISETMFRVFLINVNDDYISLIEMDKYTGKVEYILNDELIMTDTGIKCNKYKYNLSYDEYTLTANRDNESAFDFSRDYVLSLLYD